MLRRFGDFVKIIFYEKELADYILCLSECLAHTKQANDQQYYTMYLANAAVILALLEI